MFARGCGKCTVGVYGKLGSQYVSEVVDMRNVREHHVKRDTQLLGNVRRSKTWRIGNDGVRNEWIFVSH
jgi:hypothetical protein